MIHDIGPVFWKEWRELLRAGPGHERGSIAFGIAVLALGAWSAGVIVAGPFGVSWGAVNLSGFLAALTAASAAGDSFAGERERRTLETLLATCLSDAGIFIGKIAATVAYAWGASLIFLAAGVVTSAVLYGWRGALGLGVVFGSGLSLVLAVLVAGVGVLTSLRASTVRQAQQALMLSLTALGLAPYLAYRFLPVVWKDAIGAWVSRAGWRALPALAALLLVAASAVVWAGMARFRRERLILF